MTRVSPVSVNPYFSVTGLRQINNAIVSQMWLCVYVFVTPVIAFCLFCSVEFMHSFFLRGRDRESAPLHTFCICPLCFFILHSGSSFILFILISASLCCCIACLLPRATSETVWTFCLELIFLEKVAFFLMISCGFRMGEMRTQAQRSEGFWYRCLFLKIQCFQWCIMTLHWSLRIENNVRKLKLKITKTIPAVHLESLKTL